MIKHIIYRETYSNWLQTNSKLTSSKATLKQPLISIVVPVFRPNLQYFEEFIGSIQSQSYANWELCLCDDASNSPELSQYLENLTRSDKRIITTKNLQNLHISRSTNKAVELAKGDWVVFSDQDDLLDKEALNEIAHAIEQNPEAELIYSDEDKLTTNGKRHSPYFKPDWSPELLLSQNYVNHLCAMRKPLFDELGGLRPNLEGAQDHDLLLRASKELSPSQVIHIPQVLYHWRILPTSTAGNSEQKPYALKNAVTALSNHLNDLLPDYAPEVSIEKNKSYSFRIQKNHPSVSIIILNKDAPELLAKILTGLLSKTNYPDFEIIIVDHESTDEKTRTIFSSLSSNPKVKILPYRGEFNFSKMNNLAAEKAFGEMLCFINNDVEVIEEDWLMKLASYALLPNAGAVGPKLLYPSFRIQHAGIILGIGPVAGHAFKFYPDTAPTYQRWGHLVRNVSAVTGAVLLLNSATFKKVGGFDSTDFPNTFSDVDLCCRLTNSGYRNIYVGTTKLIHHESSSRGKFKDESDIEGRFNQKWKKKFPLDPFYSQHLTKSSEDFSISTRSLGTQEDLK